MHTMSDNEMMDNEAMNEINIADQINRQFILTTLEFELEMVEQAIERGRHQGDVYPPHNADTLDELTDQIRDAIAFINRI